MTRDAQETTEETRPFAFAHRVLIATCIAAGVALVLGLFAMGLLLRRQQRWFVHSGIWGYGVMMTTGLVIGIAVEWIAVYLLGRWRYTAWMRRVPGLAVGLVPVLQMLMLPLTHLSPRGQVAEPGGTALMRLGGERG
jgi:hypothetical protein